MAGNVLISGKLPALVKVRTIGVDNVSHDLILIFLSLPLLLFVGSVVVVAVVVVVVAVLLLSLLLPPLRELSSPRRRMHIKRHHYCLVDGSR